jgi:hypothetical protein
MDRVLKTKPLLPRLPHVLHRLAAVSSTRKSAANGQVLQCVFLSRCRIQRILYRCRVRTLSPEELRRKRLSCLEPTAEDHFAAMNREDHSKIEEEMRKRQRR